MIGAERRDTHLEAAMGTVVGITSAGPLPRAALRAAVDVLHEADRVFSTWNRSSPMARLRAGEVDFAELAPTDRATIGSVLDRCVLARELSGGAFDPWAMPGGVDPTGLVKGWAVGRARAALRDRGVDVVMVNGGGDIAVAGRPGGAPWRVGVRHPDQPTQFAAVLEVVATVATSGTYERPGELLDPASGRAVGLGVSATVLGPDLDLVDALATGLAVGGPAVLPAIDRLAGYEAYLISQSGRHYATTGMPFAPAR